jgi:hypothetical protein
MYGEEIDDYVRWAYNNNLVQGDYATIETEYDKNYSNEAWYKTLQEEDVIKCLALAIRRDRFADGFLVKTIKDGSFEKLVNRIKDIHNA